MFEFGWRGRGVCMGGHRTRRGWMKVVWIDKSERWKSVYKRCTRLPSSEITILVFVYVFRECTRVLLKKLTKKIITVVCPLLLQVFLPILILQKTFLVPQKFTLRGKAGLVEDEGRIIANYSCLISPLSWKSEIVVLSLVYEDIIVDPRKRRTNLKSRF